MPVIEKTDLIKIVDRLAKQYEILASLADQINPTAVAATLTLTPGSVHTGVTFTAVETGTDANRIKVEFRKPDQSNTSDQSLPLNVVVQDTPEGITVRFNLATNASAVAITTPLVF